MRITLCGSTKFIEDFHKYNKHLTLGGHVIYSVAASVHAEWTPTEEEKAVLDMIHLAKIDNSDAIFVIDRPFGNKGEPQTYIGKSTRREIKYAAIKNKKVFYASKHDARKLLFDVLPISRGLFSSGMNKADDWKS